jgi:pimeloyl-ACP methyl ester carboxylesterase
MTSATGPSRANAERTVPGLSPALRARLRWLFRVLGALSPALAARLALRMFLTPLARRIAADEARFLNTAKSRALKLPSGRLQTYEWPATPAAVPGVRAAGAVRTVLVVHGWISHAARLAAVIRALGERGLRVVAFDAPAHGRSSGRQADLQDFRDAIKSMIATYGPVDGVVAHSFGALTTTAWLVEDQPASVRAAVLVGMMSDFGYIFETFTRTLALNADVLARLRERFRARYGLYPDQFSTLDLVGRLRLPIMLVHGGIDDIVPVSHASEVAQQLHDGRVLIVEHLGHGAPLRDPATVAQIADFLATELVPAAPAAPAPAPRAAGAP